MLRPSSAVMITRKIQICSSDDGLGILRPGNEEIPSVHLGLVGGWKYVSSFLPTI